MYVCICNGITDKQIKKAIAGGVTSLEELHDELGVASQCGSCSDHAMMIIDEAQARQIHDDDLFYALA